MKKLLSIALLLTGIVLSSCEGEAQGEFFSIKNNQFWKTADGRSIYSQGGGIFKFPIHKRGKKNTIGMVFITKRLHFISKVRR